MVSSIPIRLPIKQMMANTATKGCTRATQNAAHSPKHGPHNRAHASLFATRCHAIERSLSASGDAKNVPFLWPRWLRPQQGARIKNVRYQEDG